MPKMSQEIKSPSGPMPPARKPSLPGGERLIESSDLLEGAAEVLIHHEGRIYRLRRTRLGKLILTA